MKKRIILFGLFLLILNASSCNSEKNDLNKLKSEIYSKYSSAEINYFYETAFNRDYGFINVNGINKDFALFKWGEDIYIKLNGDYAFEDSMAVLHVCKSINSLRLPIKIEIASKEFSRRINMNINFYPLDTLRSKGLYSKDKTRIGAKGSLFEFFGISHVSISIPTDIFEQKLQKSAIMEEIVQGLGVFGDSYTYPNSIFYEGVNFATEFLPIDIKVLQLLYEPVIPKGILKSEFYSLFSDILPSDSINLSDYAKFEEHIRNSNYSEESIKLFLSTAFCSNNYIDNQHVQKWKGPIIIELKGNYNAVDSIQILEDITKFSKLTKQDISLLKKGSDLIDNVDFTLFSKPYSNKPNYSVFRKWVDLGVGYQLFSGNVSYNKNEYNNETRSFMNFKLLSILSGLNFPNKSIANCKSIIFNEKPVSERVFLSNTDKDVFDLFFNPVLKSGMLKSEVFKILMKYYRLENFYNEFGNYSSLKRYLKESLVDSTLSRQLIQYLGLEKSEDEKLLKMPLNFFLSIKGNSTFNQKKVVETIVKSFNSLNTEITFDLLNENNGIPNLEIYFADSLESPELFIDAPIIKDHQLNTFEFINDFNQPESRFYSSRIIINKNDEIENIEANIILAILKFIGIQTLGVERSVLDIQHNGIVLSKQIKQVISTYYNPAFQNGMEKKKVMEILEKLQYAKNSY